MSDDKNTDDFSWLFGDDDEPQDDQPADDTSYDWEMSGSDEPRLPDDRLGFTGDLSWRQGAGDLPDVPGSQSDSGLTGQLPWMRRHTPDEEPSAEDDDLNWLRDEPAAEPDDQAPAPQQPSSAGLSGWDEEAEDAGPEPGGADIPAWLLGDEAAFDETEDAETPPTGTDIPTWLSGADEMPEDEPVAAEPYGGDSGSFDEESAPEAGGADIPAWLMDEDAAFEEPEDVETPPGGTSLPGWLADDDEVSEEEAFDVEPQGFAFGVFDEEAEPELGGTDMPAWLTDEEAAFKDAQPEPPAQPAAGLPAWLAGDDEMPDAEPVAAEPDDSGFGMFDEQAAPESAGADMPAWLMDEEPTFEDAQPEPPAQPAAGLPAWLMDEEPAAEVPLVDDTGALSEEWLKTGELLPDTADSELTFDEWMARQAEAERIPDIEEQVPQFDTPAAEEIDAAQVGTSDLPDWFLGLDEMDTSGAPDWFTGEAPLPVEPPAPPPAPPQEPIFDESFFEQEAMEPGLESLFGETEPEAAPASATDEFDLDALFGSSDTGDTNDWFTETEAPAAQPDWLEELGSLENLDQPASPPQPVSGLEPADLSFLEAAETAPPVPDDDIDSLLAAIGGDSGPLPAASTPAGGDFDFDTLLDDSGFDDFPPLQQPGDEPLLSPDTPEWLTEMGATVGGVSAAALLRRRDDDRPLDALPDRLRRLRARGEDVLKRRAPAESGALAELLPGVEDMLPPAPVVPSGTIGIAADLTLTPDQRSRVELLMALAGYGEDEGAPASTATVIDAPFLEDEDDFPFDSEYQEEAVAEPEAEFAAAAPGERRLRLKPLRLLIALLVAAGVILPSFVDALRIGDLPPAEFAADSRQRAAFATLDGLRPGALVLVGVEYGPTAAGELDDLTRVLLHHILARRARPVVVGTNPIGVLRADTILQNLGRADSPLLAQIGRSTPLRPNADYYVTRYLPAASVGLRALDISAATLLASDVRGQPTGLNVTLADFAAVVVVGERPEDMRAWAEQIAPLTGTPLIAATGFGASPLVEPYLGAAFTGLLVGFPDAYTYGVMLNTVSALQPSEPLPPETETTTPEATDEAAPTPLPPTATPTPVPVIAVIFSTQAVNVREGPGTTFSSRATAAPGSEVFVLGQSDDTLWTNIQLQDGVEGWVSTSLLRLRPTETETAPATATLSATTVPPTPTPEATVTTAASATPPPTETLAPTSTLLPTATGTVAPSATPQPSATPLPPTPTPEPPRITAVVISGQGVNVRSGPGTTFQPVTSLPSGAEVEVIGRNGDGTWIEVRLADGREGWVSASLLRISTPAGSSFYHDSDLVVVMADADFGTLLRQSADPPLAQEADAELPIPYAEQRWYGMNLGLLVIVFIILAGVVVNTARGILRRRR